MVPITITPQLEKQITERADVLRHQYEQKLWRQTDRLFALLLTLQWIAGIIMAEWLSPWVWAGLDRHIHPHVWAAVFLGGIIASLPITLAIVCPGETITRFVISVAQMLHSALLIHLSGGRIETHFHVFGSLAFLSFYRDWRVLVPATVVVALDHMLRGMFWPQSVFGVDYASQWRWLEHAGWVVFEDIFLVWSCIRGARELAMLATRQAELETSNEKVEAEVARQTRRLEEVSQELVSTARRAGMADVATGVLHNVGNVLNTVNVSASVIAKRVRESEIGSLTKVAEMLRANEANLPAFLTIDERGRNVPPFIIELADCLNQDQGEILGELQVMERGLDHIKQIVGQQQQHAKSGTLRQKVSPVDLAEEAIALDLGASTDQMLEIVRDFEPIAPLALDKHKVLQVLINLLSNAKRAVLSSKTPRKQITVSSRSIQKNGQPWLRFQVSDNGIGIEVENLTKIFSHGFTTREEGHGFGLHSAANAAGEMGGKLSCVSDGPGLGSRFTLEIPVVGLSSFEQMALQRKVA